MATTKTANSTRSRARPRPATSGTAFANSTRRCRAGGCGRSTRRSCSRSSTGWSIPPGRCSPASPTACSATPRAARSPQDVAAIKAQRALDGSRPRQGERRRDRRRQEAARLALAHGKAAFAENCAPCHGSGGQGGKGYRNLTNDDWLWGGTLDAIQTTITHGIRDYADKDTRTSAMPAFGKDGILKPEEIRQVVSYVRTLSKLEPEAGRRRRRRQEDLRRQLRGVSWRRRQGQSRIRLGQPDRRLAALRLRLQGPDPDGDLRAQQRPCRPGARASIR